MIKQLKFKNVYSFKDETIIDFIKKDKLKESNEYVYNGRNDDFLKFLIVYGKNNVGKTNLLRIINMFYLFVQTNSNFDLKTLSNWYKEVAFYGSKDEPIEFEIINLLLNKDNKYDEYRYGFSFDSNKILTEYLYIKNGTGKEAKVFDKNVNNYNNIDQIISRNNFKVAPGLFVNLPANKLLLNIAANVGEQNSLSIIHSIINKNLNIGLDVNSTLYDLSLSRLKPEQVERITEIVKKLDINIDAITFKERMVILNNKQSYPGSPFNNPQKRLIPYFKVEGREVPLERISTGTKKIINYLSFIIDFINNFNKISKNNSSANKENFLITMDEFDAGLHPIILGKLINDLLSTINYMQFESNIQLLITTHNPLLLGDKHLRRDQVLFIEKNNRNVSHIAELSNMSVRKDLNLAKAFIEGKLGGIPELKDN